MTLVFCSGTTQPIQWALQALGAVLPVDYGSLKTIPLWMAAANQIGNSLDSYDPNKPILYCGHSYGSCVMSILALKNHKFNVNRVIKLAMFGTPKPFDIKGLELLTDRLTGTPIEFINVQTTNDPICNVPPDLTTAGFMSPILGSTNIISNAATFKMPRNVLKIDSNGTLTWETGNNASTDDIINLAVKFVNSDFAPIVPHLIETYSSSLRRSFLLSSLDCPTPQELILLIDSLINFNINIGTAQILAKCTLNANSTIIHGLKASVRSIAVVSATGTVISAPPAIISGSATLRASTVCIAHPNRILHNTALLKCVTTISANPTQVTTCTTSGTEANSGSGVAWLFLASVHASDNSRASSTVATASPDSQNLDLTNFGFTLPSSTINGIEFSIEREKTGLGTIADNTVQLIIGGTATGTNKADATAWTTSDLTVRYGGSNDLWGLSPSYTDINASNFGVRVKISLTAGTGGKAAIDYICLKIYYTLPLGGLE